MDADVNNYTTQISETVVSLSSGNVSLRIRMHGYTPNAVGAHVGLVSLTEFFTYDTSTNDNAQPSSYLAELELFQDVMTNQFSSHLNAIPGNRIVFHTLTNYLVSFDRLQFYYYHKQNLTEYS